MTNREKEKRTMKLNEYGKARAKAIAEKFDCLYLDLYAFAGVSIQGPDFATMKTQLELAQVSAVAAMASDPENQFAGRASDETNSN
jgi:hypothetical protein